MWLPHQFLPGGAERRRAKDDVWRKEGNEDMAPLVMLPQGWPRHHSAPAQPSWSIANGLGPALGCAVLFSHRHSVFYKMLWCSLLVISGLDPEWAGD